MHGLAYTPRSVVDDLDEYGATTYRYEGDGELHYAGMAPMPMQFDARQLGTGEVVIGCVPVAGLSLGDQPLVIIGTANDGKKLVASGPFSNTFLRIGGSSPTAHFHCTELSVTSDAPVMETTSYSFAINNLVFGRRYAPTRRTVTLELPFGHVTLSALDEYEHRERRLRKQSGIAITAKCDVRAREAHGAVPTPEDVVRLVDSILHPLSLATGTLVSWHSYSALDSAGDVLGTVHKGVNIDGPFSNLILMMGWDADLATCATGWFNRPADLPFVVEDIIPLIRQHIDACIEGPFLETRGLAAATLLDVLANQNARQNDTSNVVEPEAWKESVLPALRNTLRSSRQSLGLTKTQVQAINMSLAHAYRRSFRGKLVQLLEELDVNPKSLPLDHVVDARNNLVHEATFSSASDFTHFDQFAALMLLGRSILLRLVGAESDLHQGYLPEGVMAYTATRGQLV